MQGTSPKVGLCPTTPVSAAGMRMDPPWSPEPARSTSPVATRTLLPLDEPPAVRVGSHGLRTGPVLLVCEPADRHRPSHTALPAMAAPASSSRVTTVASSLGVKVSTSREPFIIGTPATAVLSLTATRMPASGPSGLSWAQKYAGTAPALNASPTSTATTPTAAAPAGPRPIPSATAG